jgi:hypothetical protein
MVGSNQSLAKVQLVAKVVVVMEDDLLPPLLESNVKFVAVVIILR